MIQKLFGRLALARSFIFTMASLATLALQAVSTPYINSSGVSDTADCTEITSSSTTLNTGWYVVNGTVSIRSTVTVNGDVKLILSDRAKLTVAGSSSHAGITVADDGETVNSLTIYCQSGGSGELSATGGSGSAGIGGDNRGGSAGTGLADCGTVIIYGGIITAKGTGDGAGIGGGDWYGKGGTVAIYGGRVTAQAGSNAAGIGRGYGSSTENGTLTVGSGLSVLAGADEVSAVSLTPDSSGAVTLGGQKWFFVGPPILRQMESVLKAAYRAGMTVDVPLSSTISGGSGTYSFAVAEDSVLPSWLSLSGTSLVGAPPSAGVWTFTLRVTDTSDASLTLDANYTLSILVTGDISVTFVGENGAPRTETCKIVESDFTTLSDTGTTEGWYVVYNNVEFSSSVAVSGDIKLVLMDGKTMTAAETGDMVFKAGLQVAAGNSLTIYAQSGGSGTLNVTGGSLSAGIGGSSGQAGGTVTINGGVVNATSSSGAGIGGGYKQAGGSVTINGGTVTAVGNGAGIGGGSGSPAGAGGTVVVNGGTVTATGGYSSAGVGGGSTSVEQGLLTVGANVTVKAGSSANPTTVLVHGAGGTITLEGQRYFTFETTGPVPLAQAVSQFTAYTRESKNWNLAETVSGGTTPYSFALASGSSLPSGLELSGANNATLSGSVATPDTYNFTLTVTDAVSPDPQVQNFAYTLVVSAPAALSATAGLGSAKIGKAVNFTLSDTISGGVPSYTFAVTGGETLPTGFELNNGVLSGTASAAGSLSFKITVTDSLGSTLPITYTLEAVESAGFIEDDPEEPESGVSVDCLTEDGVVRKRLCNTVASSASAVVWEDSWYYVTGNVTLSAGATVNGEVSLVLADGATLTVQPTALGKAGISVAAGNTLTIYAQSKGTGAGKLIATGTSDGAGIGGDYNVTCGKINIYGGDITATGAADGAGIGGGGGRGAGGTVVVNGGRVAARSSKAIVPGIGAQAVRDQGTLTVGENVVVKAGSTSNPETVLEHGAGGAITLSGDKQYFVLEEYVLQPLVQTGNTLVAYLNEATDLTTLLAGTVSGGETPYSFAFKSGTLPGGISTATLTGTPTAEGGPYSFTVTVTDDAAQEEDFTYSITVVERIEGKEQVTFPGEDGNPRTEWCTPITEEVEGNTTVLSTGWYVVSSNVTLATHSLDVSGNVRIVLAAGKTLTVSGYDYYAGALAGISVTNDNVLSIYGTGSLVASGTYRTPGIGGDGNGNPCGTVKIYGGNITANGADSAAGIGGGYHGSGGVVEIYGGTIVATGGDYGAGIGGGTDGAGGTVTIRGGTITATGGQMGGSGIGGGQNGDGANVTISGGTVTATGNDSYKPTGIGGNYYASSDGTLTTTPNVTVKAGNSPSPTEVMVRNASTGEITLQRFKYYTVESETVSGLQLISSALSAYAGKTPTWNLASTISGGTPPYSFALSGSSSLPSGLTVSSAGVPSGSAGAGTYNFTFNVTDSAGAEPLAASYTLTVNPFTALAAVSGAGTLGTVAKNGSVNIDFSAKVSGGVQPCSFAVASGSDLPTGLSLNVATGALTGSPTSVGEYAFTITVTDSDSPADSVNIACTLSVKEKYSITYYESDGTTRLYVLPVEYYGGEGAPSLGTPAKAGYIFAGWYANPDLVTGGVVTSISASDNGNKTFYAKWTEKSSKMPVTFIGADGSAVTTNCTSITEDSSVLETGWYVVSDSVILSTGKSLSVSGDVSVVLLDEKSLTIRSGAGYCAGIIVTNGHSLAIYGQSVNGTGSLTVKGGTGGAGIGGGNKETGGTIAIYGGTVNATGGMFGAGIGGGNTGAGGTITISGGTVTATGGKDGAGIGGGSTGNGATVTITGGAVTATAGEPQNGGSSHGAGIGGGAVASNHGTLTVAADIVVKAGESASPTAEKTRDSETGAITLNGERYYTAEKGAAEFNITYMSGSSPVELAPSNYTYGVGLDTLPVPESAAPAGLTFDGWYDSLGALVTSIGTEASGDITLYAKWTVKTETYRYTDGSGYPHVETCTAITNGTTELSAGWYIVTDSLTLGNTVTINGAVNLVLKDGKTLTVTGTNNKAGITVLSGNSLTIYGESLGTGALDVTGGLSGAGIGGDNGMNNTANGTCGAVTINGGRITATGGTSGAGIGGGFNGSGGTIVVNGGTVVASGGGASSAGIGGGTRGLDTPTHGTLYVAYTLSVKAGSSSDPTENATRDGLNYVELTGQRYFTITLPTQYNITYYIDGVVTNLLPATYKEGAGATLPMGIDLTREGYDFNGWYTNSLCTGEKVTKILASETGDKEFYAHWTAKKVTVTFAKNDGSGTVVEVRQVNYGEAVGTLPTPTREGYDLDGWYANDSGSGEPYQASTHISANTTLYAHWVEKPEEDDWPADTTTVEGQTAAEAYGVTGDLASVNAKDLADWAKGAGNVDFADRGDIIPEAFLLNCANTAAAVTAATPVAQEAIKITAISFDSEGKPELTYPATYGNGEVVLQGSATIGSTASWHDGKQSTDRFFRTTLKLK